MHELAVVKDLIKQIKVFCKKNKIKSPDTIHLKLGEITTYKKEPILLYFDLLKKDDKLISASKLKITVEKGKLLCNACGKTSKILQPYMMFCGKCDSLNVKVLQGRDFKIEKIDFKS